MANNQLTEDAREAAEDLLTEAQNTVRNLKEASDLIYALKVLGELPEKARQGADDLEALITTLSEDLDARLQKLRAEVLAINDDKEVVTIRDDEQKPD